MSEKDHGRLLYLDGWRGLAILTVLVGHFAPPALGMAGSAGVDLFFVLSGRLMAQILVLERFPLGSFFLRRFSRIYPAILCYACFALLISVAARVRGSASLSLISPLDFVAALTMWVNYKVALIGPAGILNHLWSISVEEHSYLILALLAALFHRSRRIGWLVAAIACLAAINGALQTAAAGPRVEIEHAIYWRTDVRLAPLFLSFALRLMPDAIRQRMGVLTLPLLLAGVALYMMPLSYPTMMSGGAVCLALAVNGLDAARIGRAIFEWRPLRFVGVISYSLYLWQQPIYAIHTHLPVFVSVPIAFALALASFHWIEAPSRAAINRWWDARRRRHLAPAPEPAVARTA